EPFCGTGRGRELGTREPREQPLGVPVLPALLTRLGRVDAIELDERVDEMAAHGRRAEKLRQLGEREQPLGVPRCPVGIVAVHDAIDDVMRFGSLVQEVRDAVDVAHGSILPCRARPRGWTPFVQYAMIARGRWKGATRHVCKRDRW